MKTAQLLSIVMVGALSAGTLCAQGMDGGKLGKMQERQARREQIREKMRDQMKAQDAELDKAAAEMNAATGEKKVDAVAAAVNKLIEQRKAMHKELESLHKQKQLRKEERRSATPGAEGSMASPSGQATP